MIATMLALVLAVPAPAAPAPRSAGATPADRLAAAAREAEEIERAFYAELKKAARDMPAVSAANDKYNEACRAWAERVVPLIRQHPAEPAALDAILALEQLRSIDEDVLQILREHHFASPKVGQLVYSLAQSSDPARRQFAEEVAEKHPDRLTRARATLDLGRLDRIYLVDSTQPEPSFGGRLGPPEVLRKRAAEYLRRVIDQYADVPAASGGAPGGEGETLGQLARAELAGLENVGRLEVGGVAPDIVGEDLDGNPLRMTTAGGRVSVVVFWGTWCGPCMRLVPREVALAERYKGRPFALFGVNGGDERPKARAAAAEKKMTWPSFYSGNERGGIAAAWNVQAWPTVYVIDPAGVIRYKGHGDGLEEAVEACVAAAEAKAGTEAGDQPRAGDAAASDAPPVTE